ncbi:hypothetical protein GE061_004102 [Apolygus lucorum]|uniref:Small integral membrane protein 29 n=1 Tax=Apolygus lucorum TaxID=248454 RepID=A0A6A4IS16_APOLU|nr:hypothetical protein GE061_004102 [Apolygus lucorum]
MPRSTKYKNNKTNHGEGTHFNLDESTLTPLRLELRTSDRTMLNLTETNSTGIVTSTIFPTVDAPEQEETDRQNLSYLIVPFCSLFLIGILTIAVILLIKRKRRIDRLRHHLMPFYNFAPGEEEDWETELLESEGEIQTRRGYSTFSQSDRLQTEVF